MRENPEDRLINANEAVEEKGGVSGAEMRRRRVDAALKSADPSVFLCKLSRIYENAGVSFRLERCSNNYPRLAVIFKGIRNDEEAVELIRHFSESSVSQGVHSFLMAPSSNPGRYQMEIPAELTARLFDADWSDLREIAVNQLAIGPEGAKTLAEKVRLTKLELEEAMIGDEGICHLTNSEALSRVESLKVGGDRLGVPGFHQLLRGGVNPELCSLSLSGDRLGNLRANELPARRQFKQLRELFLGQNDLGPDNVEALMTAFDLSNLKELELGSNKLGSKGLCALVQSGNLDQIERLGLSSCHLMPDDLRCLMDATAFPSLKELNLSFNPLYSDSDFNEIEYIPCLQEFKEARPGVILRYDRAWG